MIPKLVSVNPSVPWAILPPGVHTTTLAEAEAHFATTPYRLKLFWCFVRATEDLARAGCTNVFLDGSFVSGKPHPGDFDGCWDPTGVDPARLDPVLLDFTNERREQKKKYLGEMFIAVFPAAPGTVFLDFFRLRNIREPPKEFSTSQSRQKREPHNDHQRKAISFKQCDVSKVFWSVRGDLTTKHRPITYFTRGS